LNDYCREETDWIASREEAYGRLITKHRIYFIDIMKQYRNKYLKYKAKYLALKKLLNL